MIALSILRLLLDFLGFCMIVLLIYVKGYATAELELGVSAKKGKRKSNKNNNKVKSKVKNDKTKD